MTIVGGQPFVRKDIKAVIFDLDDTLYDCSGTLVAAARWRSARAMSEFGAPAEREDIVKRLEEIERRLGPYSFPIQRYAEEIGHGNDIQFIKAAMDAWLSVDVSGIKPFPSAVSTLRRLSSPELGLKLFLVTLGDFKTQNDKIDELGVRDYFTEIKVGSAEIHPHEELFDSLVRRHNLEPHEILCVGDRGREEIRVGNLLGMVTVQVVHGRFKDVPPRSPLEVADHKIRRASHLPTLLKLRSIGKTPETLRIVAIGGGTGLPVVLQGVKTYSRDLTAIVAVTDSGRSSGRIRKSLGILAPGDIRNVLVAFADTEGKQEHLSELFNYRFENAGELTGTSLGNLMIAALTKSHDGRFDKAIEAASDLLGITGKVLPSTVQPVHLCADLEDGSAYVTEFMVRRENKARIKKVHLITAEDIAQAIERGDLKEETENGQAKLHVLRNGGVDDIFQDHSPVFAYENALAEIAKADIIVIAPGSLYTSVITNVLPVGVREAIQQASAMKVYVCNIITQPGQTDAYSASDHVEALLAHLGPQTLDYVIVNSQHPPATTMQRCVEEGKQLVLPDGRVNLFSEQIAEDMLEEEEDGEIPWEKELYLRHDPHKLAEVITRLYCSWTEGRASEQPTVVRERPTVDFHQSAIESHRITQKDEIRVQFSSAKLPLRSVP